MLLIFTKYFRKWRASRRKSSTYLYLQSLSFWPRFSWGDLHPELKSDYSFVRDIVHLLTNPLHALEALPLLSEEYEVWKNIIESYEYRYHRTDGCILDAIPARFLADRALMQKAVSSIDLLTYATMNMDLSLLVDSKYFTELIQSSEGRLMYKALFRAVDLCVRSSDTTTQALCCEIVKNCFPFCMKSIETNSNIIDLHDLATLIHYAGMFKHRDVVTAWFETGFWFVDEPFRCYPPVLDTDKEVFLLIAEHCSTLHKISSFRRCSRELRCDKKFMVKVLEKEASLFLNFCGRELWADTDVATLAIANSCQALVERQYSRTPECMEQLKGHLETKIQEEKGFAQVMTWGTFQGVHLDDFMRRKIGDYCNLNTPEKLQTIQQAHRKLLACG